LPNFRSPSWWHSPQVTESERTPLSRMLARVIAVAVGFLDGGLLVGRIHDFD
jgi:hypothetical protein